MTYELTLPVEEFMNDPQVKTALNRARNLRYLENLAWLDQDLVTKMDGEAGESRTFRKWHIGTGGGRRATHWKKDVEHWSTGNFACIHGVSDKWVSDRGGKGRNRKALFDKFRINATAGDVIYLHCDGKVRFRGTYLGDIEVASFVDSPGQTEEAKERNVTLGWNLTDTELREGSYKIKVERWRKVETPFKGAGKQATLYEVTDLEYYC